MAANSSPSQATSSPVRGRGRGRGGLGKYLRARGRGRGGGRPAEFKQRLVLEGEETAEIDDEDAKELEQKYGKRVLGSNADRYKEEEPVLNSDGEIEEEPDVDLSEIVFQQQSAEKNVADLRNNQEDEVDSSLDHLSSKFTSKQNTFKGKVQYVKWDDSTEEMFREAEIADANRELKARFRAKVEKHRAKPIIPPSSRTSKAQVESVTELPPPIPGVPPKAEKDEMQDFLDDLIN